jgi:hypothetical protein
LAFDGLVVVSREIAHARPLYLDNARTKIRKLTRRERRSDSLLEGDDSDALEGKHWGRDS